MKKFTLLCMLSGAIASSMAQTPILSLQPGPGAGYETVIAQLAPAGNDTSSNSLVAAVWTGGGSTGAWRAYFKFDISQLPGNAIIDSAFLSLYAEVNSGYGSTGNPTFGTANSTILSRVTGGWTKGGLTWGSQPAVSAIGIVLPQSTTATQDYVHLPVTNMVKAMRDSGNYGFALKMVQEQTYYNSMIFSSSKATNAAKRPMLDVYYHQPTGINSYTEANKYFSISPNPANGKVIISFRANSGSDARICVIDATGKTVKSIGGSFPAGPLPIDISSVAPGLYFIEVRDNGHSIVQKFMVN